IPDAPEATYVEIGLFDKKTGTTNGQADSKKDTHYVFVVNRRTFEPPDYETTISQARRDSMVTLAENRRIRLKLNLQRQGANQYEFVQVREIAADTTRLVGDSMARQPITVVVPSDGGVVDILLRPGAGSLLEISYRQPDETMIAGKLDYNNQRKLIYWDGRYYATYYKLQSVFDPCSPPSPLNPASQLHIMFRRSIPVDSTGSILWEPIEDTVSKNGCDIRYFNMHPSITLRPGTEGAVTATITWTAHIKGDTLDTLHREVLTRSVRLDSTQNRTWGMIEHVAYYRRYDAANPTFTPPNTEWGTPVLCRLDSGYMYAWSDLEHGIRARVRWHNPNNIWPITGPFSQISNIYKYPGILPGRFPSLPAFSHITSHDSGCGLLWLQPMHSHDSVRVYHQRLLQSRAPWGPSVALGPTLNNLVGGPNTGTFHYPSIDQTQDMYGRIQEVAVWEEIGPGTRNLRIRSLYTDTTKRTRKWGELVYKFPKHALFLHPSIGSLNNLNSVAYHDSLKAFFGIVFRTGGLMCQATYRYTERLLNNTLGTYTYGGLHGASSASPVRQVNRYAVIYQSSSATESALRTTRQFFARQRPTNYLAQGREVAFALEDSGGCGVRIEMFNPWYANGSTSEPVSMIFRDTTELIVDSLPHVHSLFRTKNFRSHDSTQIGLEIVGRFIGSDTTGRKVTVVVELMDSSTNAVVSKLDSFALSSSATVHEVALEPVMDLLSGTYYMRMRLDTVQAEIPQEVGESRYNVAEVFGEIGDDGTLAKMLRRESATSESVARISAQPNPLSGTTELRFSIPSAGDVGIRVFDPIGRPVAVVLSGQWMEVGRYAVGFDASQLPPGTYMVELMLGQQRVVEKMVVVR
ncbi:MAG: T9SS type A sorting domain-containing protein, partial [Armatimonadetes bacterium]|nr:T9SS type A sorting domain-containing protein [Armatimonadota bacterium]